MKFKKTYRGFVILRSAKTRHISIKLSAHNGQRYFVLIARYLFGIKYRVKYYEFEDLGTAQYVYERLAQDKLGLEMRRIPA